MSMRLLVCGSRTFGSRVTPDGSREFDPTSPETHLLVATLDGIYGEETMGHLTTELSRFTLIEGGATGADACAAWWAESSPWHHYNQDPDADVPVFEHLQFKADWKQHGKRAGFLRNQRMLTEGRPDLVLGFVDKPLEESRGTAMMVELARAAELPVFVVYPVV